MTEAQPKIAPADPILEAVRQLRDHDAKVAAEGNKLDVLTQALAKASAVIDEHAAAAQRVAQLRDERRTLLADHLLNTGEKNALERNDGDLKAAEVRLKGLASLADDAAAAITELEARYATAQAPLIALSAAGPRLRANVLELAAKPLLDDLAEQACVFYDRYLELVCLGQAFNAHARPAGLQMIFPELPARFVFPSVAWHGFQLENPIGATPQQIIEARERLAKKLADLGIPR